MFFVDYLKIVAQIKNYCIFAPAFGEMAERSNAAVLKTVEGHTSGGSNPSFSATFVKARNQRFHAFSFSEFAKLCLSKF